MVKLKRLKISKFRHVEPTELVFDDRYNVPLGINGSGKTTLLKLISACLRSDFSEFGDEEFSVEYAWDANGWAITVIATNEQLLSLGEDRWHPGVQPPRRITRHAPQTSTKFESKIEVRGPSGVS